MHSNKVYEQSASSPTDPALLGAPKQDFLESHSEQVLKHRLRHSKAGCIVTAVLILAGSGLDHFTYPDRFAEFLLWRWIAAIALLGVFALLSTKKGGRRVRSISLFWLMIPQVMIAGMILDTNGAESTYFAGMLLATYAVGTALPVTFLEGSFFGCATLVLYASACAGHADGFGNVPSGSFFTNSIFILMSAITSAYCAWSNEASRNDLLELKDEVSNKNSELHNINHTLSQIKGQLVEREKMAAVGALSTGLLQELTNPLNQGMTSISLGLGMSAVRGDKMLIESLQDAQHSMERVRTIVSDLRTYAYPAAPDYNPQVFVLERSLQSAVRLASFDLKGIPVSIDVHRDTLVVGDEPAIIGVVVNLLNNAARAVHAANRLHPLVQLRGQMKGGRVRISVHDNGLGIEPNVIGKVFEPFFTTRSTGSGFGLGLSMSVSQAIIQRHASELRVKSEPGAWTEFSFELSTHYTNQPGPVDTAFPRNVAE